jgi:hypothetical protein
MRSWPTKLSISFSTINGWENGKTRSFKLACAQFDAFCKKVMLKGKCNRKTAAKNEMKSRGWP